MRFLFTSADPHRPGHPHHLRSQHRATQSVVSQSSFFLKKILISVLPPQKKKGRLSFFFCKISLTMFSLREHRRQPGRHCHPGLRLRRRRSRDETLRHKNHPGTYNNNIDKTQRDNVEQKATTFRSLRLNAQTRTRAYDIPIQYFYLFVEKNWYNYFVICAVRWTRLAFSS